MGISTSRRVKRSRYKSEQEARETGAHGGESGGARRYSSVSPAKSDSHARFTQTNDASDTLVRIKNAKSRERSGTDKMESISGQREGSMASRAESSDRASEAKRSLSFRARSLSLAPSVSVSLSLSHTISYIYRRLMALSLARARAIFSVLPMKHIITLSSTTK